MKNSFKNFRHHMAVGIFASVLGRVSLEHLAFVDVLLFRLPTLLESHFRAFWDVLLSNKPGIKKLVGQRKAQFIKIPQDSRSNVHKLPRINFHPE